METATANDHTVGATLADMSTCDDRIDLLLLYRAAREQQPSLRMFILALQAYMTKRVMLYQGWAAEEAEPLRSIAHAMYHRST